MLIAGAVDLVQSTLPENSRQIGTVLSTFFHLSRGSFSGTESMCCAPRRSQRATRRRSSPSRAIIVLLGAAALSALSSQAEAASVTLIPSAAPAPMPPSHWPRLRPVGGRDGGRSRQQFPGAARERGIIRIRQGAPEQPGRGWGF